MHERIDYTEMDGPQLLDACGADAMKWAQAFCQIKMKQRWTAADIDEALMVSWFANAIETACRDRMAIA